MSKKCINCGAELDDVALFCDECGTQQVVLQASVENQALSMQNNMPSAAMNQVDEKMKSSRMSIAAFIMGILAICTLGIFFIPEILGLVFGVMAITDDKKNRTLAIGGIVMSGIALVFGIIIWIAV